MISVAPTMNLNLLPSEAKFQAAKNKLEKKIKKVMMIMVIVWIVIIAGVYGASFLFNTKLNSEKRLQQKALTDYNALSDTVIVNQSLKYKAKMVGKALLTRFEYGKAFETVNSLFAEGTKLENFKMDPNGSFIVAGTVIGRENLDKLENLVEDINLGKDDRFESVKWSALSVRSGIWKAEMEVLLK